MRPSSIKYDQDLAAPLIGCLLIEAWFYSKKVTKGKKDTKKFALQHRSGAEASDLTNEVSNLVEKLLFGVDPFN